MKVTKETTMGEMLELDGVIAVILFWQILTNI